MKNIWQYLNIFFLCISSILLFGLELKLAGLILLAIGSTTFYFCQQSFRKDMFLLYIAFAILALTPVSTNLSYFHIFEMGLGLLLALFIPYSMSHYVYKENIIRFLFHHKRHWTKFELFYFLGVILASYIIIPYLLLYTGTYKNWNVDLSFDSLVRLFIGVNFVGAWDEFFFICTVFSIFKKFLSFIPANIAQSILFTSFLYELGFRSLFIIVVLIFTLFQGYIFNKTKDIPYIVTVHLSVDMILFLALIHVHYPHLLRIFLF